MGQLKLANGGVERRKQLILHEDASVGESVEESRLSCVRVSDDRHDGITRSLALLASRGAGTFGVLEQCLDLSDTFEDAPSIGFELRLAGAPRADASTEP